MKRALLGGMTAARFLREHWQRRLLLVRSAIPGFSSMLSPDALFALCARDDVESRVVVREGRRWSIAHGPFRHADRRALPSRNWTLLVQGVNLHVPAADALLRRFAFIPYARLDDLMVSLAAPGGGVGPHVDSYDVFLLQGFGRRRWRISHQRDLAFKRGQPVKVLARFRPQRSWVLAGGDMLYLPPQIAHEGTAIDACATYSIGFRAPAAQDLAVAFLDWLRDRIAFDGRYADRGLAETDEPALIVAAMRRQAVRMLQRVRWTAGMAEEFLGVYLTEPKPSVRFEPPSRPLIAAAFRRAAQKHGLRLDTRSQLLYDDRHLFINGEAMIPPARGLAALHKLANARHLSAAEIRRVAPLATLYDWYRDGFLRLD